jgi:hypothetical protein
MDVVDRQVNCEIFAAAEGAAGTTATYCMKSRLRLAANRIVARAGYTGTLTKLSAVLPYSQNAVKYFVRTPRHNYWPLGSNRPRAQTIGQTIG